MNQVLLIIGYFFSFFLIGFLVIEVFFKKIPILVKLPLYIIFSVLISTWLIYFVGLAVGLSRLSILLSFIIFIPLVFYLPRNNLLIKSFAVLGKKHLSGLMVAAITLIIFFISLFPAIFWKHNGYYVMSAVNWQDTAMHLGIIESISQGNFPPQAPYFAGKPLAYYYFSDFHSAILNILYGNFFPRILVYTNPIFVFLFSFSVYALGYIVTKSKKASLLASFLVVYGGSFIYVRFIQDLISKFTGNGFSIQSVIELLARGGYTLEFGKMFQMTPMSDYFLQNRPMMIGLPAVAIVSALLYLGYRNQDHQSLVAAGMVTGMVSRFQLFSTMVNLLVFWFVIIASARKMSIKRNIVNIAFFILPVLIFLLFTYISSAGERSVIEIFTESFRFGPWDNQRSLAWYLQFFVLNFGITFIVGILLSPFLIILKINNRKSLVITYFLLIVLFAIPHIMKFTIYEGDMFKLFYFMKIYESVLVSFVFVFIWKKHWIMRLMVTAVIIVSVMTSPLALIWSYLNKNQGYSQSDFQSGMWIRYNTPQNSIFVSMPTVHTPITQIGGRLRLLSYINWPYSHGFDRGEDNVFSRLDDIKKIYDMKTSDRLRIQVLDKYQVNFVFLGSEENSEYPGTEDLFDKLSYFEKVYNSQGIKIYEYKKY